MKIYVYAICKDEKAFADRWMDSMSEADGVYVLDTGSQDGTPAALASRGAWVACREIVPWRFDKARNLSLDLVPEDADLCVCTDLDEVFEKGWRKKLEQAALMQSCPQYRCRFVWSHGEDGREGMVFWQNKIHCRHGFVWHYPVHEVLQWQGEKEYTLGDAVGVCLHHWPDSQKSRGQYLPLLELAAREEPEDPRCAHYLGREYMYQGDWNKAEEELLRHLALPRSTWEAERAASMRYLARCCLETGRRKEALRWFYRAVAEAPSLRESYVECAWYFSQEENWPGVLLMSQSALAITQRDKTYINEDFAWGSVPWDLSALAFWHLGQKEKACFYGARALEKEPENQRLKENLAFYQGEK